MYDYFFRFFSYFRYIYNLSFGSNNTHSQARPTSCSVKILKKILKKQINFPIVKGNIPSCTQSGRCKVYGYAYALLDVTNDILKATDRGNIS